MYGRVLMKQIAAGDFSNIGLVSDTFVDIGETLGLGKNGIQGLGHTTHQVQNAPIDAFFVWCDNEMRYIYDLVLHLNRPDLQVKNASWLNEGFLRFKGPKQIVIDHRFADLNPGPQECSPHDRCI